MGLFDKKICDICGEKIGLLGNRKVEDGNVCKNCAKKLSPFFSERRKSTLADIRAQLAYREANKAAVAAFRCTRSFGTGKKVMIDDNTGKFMVTDGKKIAEENPDVMDLSQVRSSRFDVRESSTEITFKDADGNNTSYSPRRYRHRYDFYMDIDVDSPWFDKIRYALNTNLIEIDDMGLGASILSRGREGSRGGFEYNQCEALANDIVSALMTGNRPVTDHMGVPAPAPAPVQAPEPPKMKTCPYCGFTGFPNDQGNCFSCGGNFEQ